MNMRNLFIFTILAVILGLFASCGKTADSKLVAVPGKTLAEKFQWLNSNAASSAGYLLEVNNALEELTVHDLSYSGTNITIQLRGIGKDRVISLSGDGPLFIINSGVTLILNNITLTGTSDNYNTLVQINHGGSLEINQGVKISGNNGSGVHNYGGTLTMTGGEISGNSGGGVRNNVIYTIIDEVYMTINGTFTMTGGKISGNTVADSFDGGGVHNNGTFTMSGGEISGNSGGGVYNDGTFTMDGGKITGNTASSFHGGGVYNGVIYTMIDGVYMAVNGTFTMTGGEISENISSYGGGVSNHGIFTMEDGKISGNTAAFFGGGVDNHGTFTMKNGKISGNITFFYGGGVSNSKNYTYTYEGYVSNEIFILNGGEISGNTASYGGGGVYMGNGMSFFKTGGTITGYTNGDVNSNVIKDDLGDVQNKQGHSVYTDNDNASYIKQKDTTVGPADVLSFNGKLDPPVWDGKWDN
jgi:hypothetical protein